ncbi:hypothetical protein IHE44_0009502 [Lamprotornis superbus]|uniref:Sine oculis-binding protein homolog n=1 Tax=Lamprotornis superbus TaxID=245042 RepID=A0A835P4J6_9PASS|nr:hypothetical protein IHE44_0009502 [Lamprotornis superbus]
MPKVAFTSHLGRKADSHSEIQFGAIFHLLNFAENTMNELLGWYGYDKVELKDGEDIEFRNYSADGESRQHISVLKENSLPKPKLPEDSVISPYNINPSYPGLATGNGLSDSPAGSKDHGNVPIIVPLIPPPFIKPPADLWTTSEAMLLQRILCEVVYMKVLIILANPTPKEDDVSNVQIMCAWCQKVGIKRYSLSMGSEVKCFCSEKCFAACRRAYFKRNKANQYKVKYQRVTASHCARRSRFSFALARSGCSPFVSKSRVLCRIRVPSHIPPGNLLSRPGGRKSSTFSACSFGKQTSREDGTAVDILHGDNQCPSRSTFPTQLYNSLCSLEGTAPYLSLLLPSGPEHHGSPFHNFSSLNPGPFESQSTSIFEEDETDLWQLTYVGIGQQLDFSRPSNTMGGTFEVTLSSPQNRGNIKEVLTIIINFRYFPKNTFGQILHC